MLSLGEGTCVYLAIGSTDLRKSIDGLAALVSQDFEMDLFSNSLFVFCNRDRDKLKILVWDTNGFWLYYRPLERGRFRWPEQPGQKTVTFSRRQLYLQNTSRVLRASSAARRTNSRTSGWSISLSKRYPVARKSSSEIPGPSPDSRKNREYAFPQSSQSGSPCSTSLPAQRTLF